MARNLAVDQGALNSGAGQVTIQSQTFNNYSSSTRNQPSLIEQLWFDEIKHRERAIDNAHEGTCEWLFTTSQYAQWTASPTEEWHHGLLWIKGNPGAGKSTIMKFVVDQARINDTDELILPHFFNARGTKLEQSAEGMYRTVIISVLESLSSQAADELRTKYGTNRVGGNWPVPELVRLLKAAVAKVPAAQPTTFYIDALDECDEDEIRAMLHVFRAIVKRSWDAGQRIRVCFASRPHPDTNFKDAVFVTLSQQEEHNKDISKFIEDHLDIGNSVGAGKLREILLRKASGSFMWTKLVVHILNKEHIRGSMGKLTARLAELPSDLHELYQYTLDRYHDDRPAMLVCFQWLMFAEGHMHPEQLWGAIQRGLNRSTEEITLDREFQTYETMERYVVRVSKGLVEVKDEVCQFIHQSVPDFILESGQLQKLYGLSHLDDFHCQSLELLKVCCEAELIAFRPFLESSFQLDGSHRGTLHAPPQYSLNRPTFTHHAAMHMMYYAERLQIAGMDQIAFIDHLLERIGPNVVSQSYLTYRGAGVSAIRVLVLIHDMLSLLFDTDGHHMLLATQLKEVAHARQLGLAYGLVRHDNSRLSPLWYAIVKEKGVGVSSFLALCNRSEARHPELRRILSWLREAWETWGYVGFFPAEADEQYLELGRDNPMLALFFLLAFAPPKSLEPHLETFGGIVTDRRPQPFDFLQMVLYFIRNDLHSDAVDLARPETVGWITRYQRLWDADREPTYRVCEQILEELRTRTVHGKALRPGAP